jgi:hypothetical protein
MGRHLQRSMSRFGAGAALAAGLALALAGVAPPAAAAVGLLAATAFATVGVWRVIAAAERDAGEERWLRHVLDGLSPAGPWHEEPDGDEDPGLYVS